MRFDFKKALLAVIVCLMMFTIGRTTLSQVNDRSIFNKMEKSGWFFIDVLGCKLPIPNYYTLKIDTSNSLYFYADANKFLLDGPMNFSIMARDDHDIHASPEGYDVSYTVLKTHNNLNYEKIRYDDKGFGYMIYDQSNVVSFLEERRHILDLIFDYCVAHPIVETMDCEMIDGYYTCHRK